MFRLLTKICSEASTVSNLWRAFPTRTFWMAARRERFSSSTTSCLKPIRVTKIFTKGSHHLNCSVIYVSQNLFNKGKENKNICLNTHYLVLFKNPRDSAQIVHLGRQIFPDVIKYFKESFADATSLPYGYLLIDLRTTPDLLRLRRDIFYDDRTVVYVHRVKMNETTSPCFI